MAETLDSHRSEDENENKCLQYIEGSFRLLEQARAAVLTSSIQPTNSQPTTSSGVRSERAENAAKDFRQAFRVYPVELLEKTCKLSFQQHPVGSQELYPIHVDMDGVVRC